MNERQRRIHEARRAGLRNRMRDEWRLPEADADALLDAWAAEAARRGIDRSDPAWWADGEAWMGERRRH